LLELLAAPPLPESVLLEELLSVVVDPFLAAFDEHAARARRSVPERSATLGTRVELIVGIER